jgi:hypothetical protein
MAFSWPPLSPLHPRRCQTGLDGRNARGSTSCLRRAPEQRQTASGNEQRPLSLRSSWHQNGARILMQRWAHVTVNCAPLRRAFGHGRCHGSPEGSAAVLGRPRGPPRPRQDHPPRRSIRRPRPRFLLGAVSHREHEAHARWQFGHAPPVVLNLSRAFVPDDRGAQRPPRPRRELQRRDSQAGGGRTRVTERVLTRKPRFVCLFPTSVCVISSTQRG